MTAVFLHITHGCPYYILVSVGLGVWIVLFSIPLLNYAILFEKKKSNSSSHPPYLGRKLLVLLAFKYLFISFPHKRGTERIFAMVS